MATIFIPTPLRKFTENNSTVELKCDNLKGALNQLTAHFPEIRQHLFDSSEKLRGFVRIFIGDDDMEDLQGLDTQVKDSDVISIIPAIAGG